MSNEALLLAAGVPNNLWGDSEATIEYLARRVVALSEEAGSAAYVFDEDTLADKESKTYEALTQMNAIDVYSTYNSAYVVSLPEPERIPVKTALRRWAVDHSKEIPDHWI